MQNDIKEKLKMYIPLGAVIISLIITVSLLYSSLSGAPGVEGLFILSGSSSSDFIKFEDDGSYQWSCEERKEEGEWKYESGKLTLTSSEGSVQDAKLVDEKYIAPLDKNFLAGEIPQGSFFDAEVNSESGEVYSFKSDGKVYLVDDGRNTEYGTYMTDGHFIIVTTKTESTTYLNCGDGITGVFYKAS